MNSRSRGTPFCLSSPRSSYAPSPPVSSPLGSSRLYGRETGLNSDRFPRASSAYKTDVDHQNSRLPGWSRGYSSSESRSTSWKLPSSLTSSSRSYDRSWAESPLSSRSKLTDSEGRLGMPSVLLNADDGDSKRAKLSYGNRGLYSRTPSSSATGATFSSHWLSSGRGTGEKQNDSSWSSRGSLSRSSSSSSSSSSSLFRRGLETRNEPRPSALGEGRIRTPGLAPALYQTDRWTSTYAQGARPKQTTYSSPSSSSSYSSSPSSSLSSPPSSTSRESALNSRLSSCTSHRSPRPACDFSSRTAARFSKGSSSQHSSREQDGRAESSSYFSRTPWRAPPSTRAEATPPPRPAPEDGEPEGRRSARRLLSRLFSRRSSQDSSSGSSSVHSLDDGSPLTGEESVDSDEGTRKSGVDPDDGDSGAALGIPRSHRAVLPPIQENNHQGYRSGLARSRMSSWREPGLSSHNNTNSGEGSSSSSSSSSTSSSTSSSSSSSSSSWLSPSLRSRCPPLLSRLRRHARGQNTHSVGSLEEGYSHPLRRWENPQQAVPQEDDDDDDDDEEEDEDEEEREEGAVGAGRSYKLDFERLPELEDASVELLAHHGVGTHENTPVSTGPSSSAENQLDGQSETTAACHQEKLRKIKERLLLEDSDEDDGDLCRICQMGEKSAVNPLIQPCRCTGSLQYVHQECIQRWLRSKISAGTNLEAVTTCELCKEKLRLNIDNFDIQELYRTHVQSEYDDFLNNGLYLVALLHFCEHFSDVLGAVDGPGLLNLARILHDHMGSLENPHGESDEEIQDNRPSIEFSDLDDDLDEY